MVERTCTQARPSCTSYRKRKKKSSELLRALSAAKEGRVWTDGEMNAEDPAQIWLGAFGRVVWPMLSHCRFGLWRYYWQVACGTKWTSCQTRPEEKPPSEAWTVDSYLRLTRQGGYPASLNLPKWTFLFGFLKWDAATFLNKGSVLRQHLCFTLACAKSCSWV